MAALTDWDDYLNRFLSPRQVIPVTIGAITTIAGRNYSSWQANLPGAGATPGAAAVPARNLSGALVQENAGSEQMFLTGARLSSSAAGTWILCDRLSHQGGLSGTTTGSQTTNLPTAALTRYTGGTEVMAALEIYSQVGTTATTVTVSYTNQAGTAGRISPAITFGGTGNREARRFIPIPLASDDLGFRSVESVSLVASTTTAGSFGITLCRPLYGFHIDRVGAQVTFNLVDGGMFGAMPEILDDACLFWVCIPDRTSANLMGTLYLTEK